MPKIVKLCPTCKKPASLVKEWKLANLIFNTFECGHTVSEKDITGILKERLEKAQACNFLSFFKDGSIPRQHQIENLYHYIESNGRHQIQDETGTGKTLSAIAEVALHPESLPIAIFCKGGPVLYQWSKTVMEKLGIVPQVLRDAESDKMVYSQVIICSLDRLKTTTFFERNKVKKVIVDEIQLIKNNSAKRTNFLREIVKETPFLTQLSGTPIENHAGEYFPSLNMLLPHIYHNYENFLRTEVNSYQNSYGTWKLAGLYDPKKFFESTRKHIIRHKLSDIADMPEVQRDFRIVEIAEATIKAYEQAEKEFLEAYDNLENGEGNKQEASLNVAAKMQKLRHITGLAKIPAVLDFLTDFLMTCDRKITIFCHFNDVADIVEKELNKLLKDAGMEPCVSLEGLSGDERAYKIRAFTEGPARILIMKILSQEGTDLFMCRDYLVMERHWNRAKEKQAEGRGTRLSAKHKSVLVSYMIGLGTIDEFISALNEQKDQYVTEALEGEAQEWQEANVIKQIAEMLKKKGKKSWKMA